ncbi:hypothetical protein V2I01_18670 [Micromonospora sp. BRA006-A]|nr:hypothetical protein [Micromonospora sp. BRA006-A]
MLPHGFCYREHDVAHLRTPAGMAVLRGDSEGGDVAYALRWRRPTRPTTTCRWVRRTGGSRRCRPGIGSSPPVLGTGFVPSSAQLVPEFVTREFADLPMPANATLLAYPAEGGGGAPHLPGGAAGLAAPGRSAVAAPARRGARPGRRPGVRADRRGAALHPAGRHVRGSEDEAVADQPGGFRVLAMTRAARYPVDAPAAGTHGGLARGRRAWCCGRRAAGCGRLRPPIRTRWRRRARSVWNAACTRPGRPAPS